MVDKENAGTLIVELSRAALIAEGKGQLNIGKLLRASAAGLTRSSGAELGLDADAGTLSHGLTSLAGRLRVMGFDAAMCDQLMAAAEVVAAGKQSYVDRFPDPWVCRRCGSLSTRVPSGPCTGCGAHPLTFERFEPIWWTGVFAPHELVARLEANPAIFREAIERLPAERHAWTPVGTKWSAIDVVRHVRDADRVFGARVALILEQEDPPLAFQPVFAWTDERSEAGTAESILGEYEACRVATVARLRGVAAGDWQRTGRHEELGRVSLAAQASYFAAHELTHLRQLEQLRRAVEG